MRMAETQIGRRGLRAVLAVAAVALATGAMAQGATVQGAPETDQIVNALKPKGLTRSLSLGPSSTMTSPTAREDAAFIDSIQARPTRPLSTGERDKLAAVSTGKPTIDLDVPFDFNSSTIGPKALPVVKNLGAALSRPELKGGTYMIAGHTDGKGGDAFNQGLSERRAEAVKRYVVTHYGVPAASLITVGYGKSKLKDAANPLADANRRVQATNISDVKSAGR
jgi:outer membrane protein OmpA-like peptidoglycan-associated protein